MRFPRAIWGRSFRDSKDDNLVGLFYKDPMDEAQTGLGLIFLLLAFVVCGGVIIWLIVSEGIRHTRQGSNQQNSPS